MVICRKRPCCKNNVYYNLDSIFLIYFSKWEKKTWFTGSKVNTMYEIICMKKVVTNREVSV